ncbi:MAG: hypothetical protein PHQ75_15070, partial [Thermoguttaceae bacterium]|nr:hypothetical protein [Thermoguttaceae bacterium]
MIQEFLQLPLETKITIIGVIFSILASLVGGLVGVKRLFGSKQSDTNVNVNIMHTPDTKVTASGEEGVSINQTPSQSQGQAPATESPKPITEVRDYRDSFGGEVKPRIPAAPVLPEKFMNETGQHFQLIPFGEFMMGDTLEPEEV